MPLPLPPGEQITVQKNLRPASYQMPAIEIATDHYSLGFMIRGDRKAITPSDTYSYHTGDVSMSRPYMYHRTFSLSDIPYESYLIKYTPEFIQPFCEKIGQTILDDIYDEKVCHFSKKHQQKIGSMFQDMLEEYEKNAPYKEVLLQGMLFRLLTTIWELRIPGETTKFSSLLTEPIMNAVYYIEQNYNQSIGLATVAKEVNLSEAYFSRLFSSQLQMSFSEYLSNVRLRHAQAMLIQTDKSIMDIALSTGYCHGDYLSTQFKNKIGVTPSAFRKMQKENHSIN